MTQENDLIYHPVYIEEKLNIVSKLRPYNPSNPAYKAIFAKECIRNPLMIAHEYSPFHFGDKVMAVCLKCNGGADLPHFQRYCKHCQDGQALYTIIGKPELVRTSKIEKTQMGEGYERGRGITIPTGKSKRWLEWFFTNKVNLFPYVVIAPAKIIK